MDIDAHDMWVETRPMTYLLRLPQYQKVINTKAALPFPFVRDNGLAYWNQHPSDSTQFIFYHEDDHRHQQQDNGFRDDDNNNNNNQPNPNHRSFLEVAIINGHVKALNALNLLGFKDTIKQVYQTLSPLEQTTAQIRVFEQCLSDYEGATLSDGRTPYPNRCEFFKTFMMKTCGGDFSLFQRGTEFWNPDSLEWVLFFTAVILPVHAALEYFAVDIAELLYQNGCPCPLWVQNSTDQWFSSRWDYENAQERQDKENSRGVQKNMDQNKGGGGMNNHQTNIEDKTQAGGSEKEGDDYSPMYRDWLDTFDGGGGVDKMSVSGNGRIDIPIDTFFWNGDDSTPFERSPMTLLHFFFRCILFGGEGFPIDEWKRIFDFIMKLPGAGELFQEELTGNQQLQQLSHRHYAWYQRHHQLLDFPPSAPKLPNIKQDLIDRFLNINQINHNPTPLNNPTPNDPPSQSYPTTLQIQKTAPNDRSLPLCIFTGECGRVRSLVGKGFSFPHN